MCLGLFQSVVILYLRSLLVLKSGPHKFHSTLDLRPDIYFTMKPQFIIPNIEHDLSKLSFFRKLVIFDLSLGYRQLLLEHSYNKCQSFTTPGETSTPTRVLHGTANAVMYL